MSVKSEVSNWKFSTFLENNNNKFNKNDILNILTPQDMDEAYQIISGWNNYSPTPLISLNKLSKELNDCKELKESFGESVINSYIKLKNMEIKEFNREEVFDKKRDISDWEKNNTLDC